MRITSIIIALLAFFAVGCSQIDTGNVGVIKTAGQYKAEELQPGWHFSLFSTVYEVSGRENVVTLPDMKPKTSDQITIEDMDVDVYYRLNPAKAQEAMTRLAGDITQNKDGDYLPGFNYVYRAARESVYNAMAKIAASDAQNKRSTIPAEIQALLQKELDSKLGQDWYIISNVNLRNLTVDTKLELAIREAAQVQYQIDAKAKQVKLAEEEAKRLRAEAQGRADAARIEALALQGAAGSTGSDYLKKMELENQRAAISKWNGVLPTTNAGGVTPFLSVR